MSDPQVRNRRLEVDWFTITYRRIILWTCAVALTAALGGFALFRDYIVRKYAQLLAVADASIKANSVRKTGHFTSIVGNVKVKKYNSVQWLNADLQTPLDAGDYIQTSPESMARIIFPEGTTYTMKPDSLIVVQENYEDPQTQAKKVSVRVTSGAIDLSTTRRDSESSTSEVSAASATAVVNQDSRLAVETDPSLSVASFLVQKGSARIVHGNDSYALGPYEKVTTEGTRLIKEKLLAPPELKSPNNIRPVIANDGAATKVEFNWEPVALAAGYRVRISNSSLFSKILKEEIVRDKTKYVTTGLGEGTYYWAVTSIDAKGKQSRESDPSKFTLIAKTNFDHDTEILLEVELMRLSNIFEVTGRTDPGATVVVNDEPVTLMSANGSFKHITSPLPYRGKNTITVTAQDRSGNTRTVRREVFVD